MNSIREKRIFSILFCFQKNKKGPRSSIGASLVEFSIIVPLFLILVFGTLEWGIFMYDKAVLTDATRAAARAGIVRGIYTNTSTGEDYDHPLPEFVQEKVQSICSEFMISWNSSSSLTVPLPTYVDINGDPINLEDAQKGDFLKIVATYDFSFLVFSKLLSLTGGTFANGITINSETIMRLE